MSNRPSVLCAADFSRGSRGALRYAAALAEHFYAALTVLTVDDGSLVAGRAAIPGEPGTRSELQATVERFVQDAFPGRTPQVPELRLVVRTGTPATEILRVARETGADAIVMSTHGTSGVNGRRFGSTTERVLRETPAAVLVTPAGDPGPDSLEAWRDTVKCVVGALDLSDHSPLQVAVTGGLAQALGTRVVLAHVLEPIEQSATSKRVGKCPDAEAPADAQNRLEDLAADLPATLHPIIAIGSGDTAAEIARIAGEHAAGAIVMALHTSPGDERRMGTVTRRLLCQTPTVVIAYPPSLARHGAFGLARGSRTGANHVTI